MGFHKPVLRRTNAVEQGICSFTFFRGRRSSCFIASPVAKSTAAESSALRLRTHVDAGGPFWCELINDIIYHEVACLSDLGVEHNLKQ